MKFAVILFVVLASSTAAIIDRDKPHSSGPLAGIAQNDELQVSLNHRLIRSVNGRPKQDSSHSVKGTNGHPAPKTKSKPSLQLASPQQDTGTPEVGQDTDEKKLPETIKTVPAVENNEASSADDQTFQESADGYTENGQVVTIIETTIILEAVTQSPQDALAAQDQEQVDIENQQTDIPDSETSGPISQDVENEDAQPQLAVISPTKPQSGKPNTREPASVSQENPHAKSQPKENAVKTEVDSVPQIEEKPEQPAKNPVQKAHPINEAVHKVHPIQKPSQPVNQQSSKPQPPQKPNIKSHPADKPPSMSNAPHVNIPKNPVQETQAPEKALHVVVKPSSKPKALNNNTPKPQPVAAQATKPQQAKPAPKPQTPHKTTSHSQPGKTHASASQPEEKPVSGGQHVEKPVSNPHAASKAQAPEQPPSPPQTEVKPVLKPQPSNNPAPVPKPEAKPQPPKKPAPIPELEIKPQPPKKPTLNTKPEEKPQPPKKPAPNPKPQEKLQPPEKPVPDHKPEEKPQPPKKPAPIPKPEEKPQPPAPVPAPKPEEKTAPKPQLPETPAPAVQPEEEMALEPQKEKKPVFVPIPKPLPGERPAPKHHSGDKISHKPQHISSKVKHDSESKGELSNNSRVALISLGVIAATLVLIVMGVWYRKISVYNYRYGGHTLLTENDDEEFGVFNRLTYNEDVKTYDSWRDID